MKAFWVIVVAGIAGAGVWVYQARVAEKSAAAAAETARAEAERAADVAKALATAPPPATPPVAPVPSSPATAPAPKDEGPKPDPAATIDPINRHAAGGIDLDRALGTEGATSEADLRELIYTVAPGDTLATITQKFYGDPSIWQRLGHYNAAELRATGYLIAGMKLRIPPREILMSPQYEKPPAAADVASSAGKDAVPPVGKNAPAEVALVSEGEALVVVKEDGTRLIDGRFTMKGEGTPEKPYEVTWEYLVSAMEVYDPGQGKKKLPGRIAMLDGKRLRITGYVAFPLYVDEPRELLSMLNQWDGCCIGIPPTPYDAIEVHLSRPVPTADRVATYGTVEGTFSVKPYLVGEWLVGLYMMEDAALTVRGPGYGT
ncbi:MAG: LysM peptidoglycan-binding domain-containing protein [Phycisphaeraceae bacterium]|nr:MAG: LysM peptidoglycan-binding domain-containing protein [Phycisphaeraceae bacterium]